MARGKNGLGIPLDGDEKRIELAGYYRRKEYADYWNGAKDELQERQIINDPAMVYTDFSLWYRAKIIRAAPNLNPDKTDENGYHRNNDHALNSLLNKILPGYKQFLEMYLERYEPTEVSQSTLDNSREDLENGGDPPARARVGNNALINDVSRPLRESERTIVGDAILRRAVALAKETGKPIGDCVRELTGRKRHGD